MSPDAEPLVVCLRAAWDAMYALRFAADPHDLPPNVPDDRRNDVISELLAAKRTCVEQLRAAEAELEAGVGRVPRALRDGDLGSRYAAAVRAVQDLRGLLEHFGMSPGHGKMPMRGKPQPGGDEASDAWDRAERVFVEFMRDLRIALLMEKGNASPAPVSPAAAITTPPPSPVSADDPLLRVLAAEHVRTVREFLIPFPLDEFRGRWAVRSVNRFGKIMGQSVTGPRTAVAVADTILRTLAIPEDERAVGQGAVPPEWRLTRMCALRADDAEVVVFDATPPPQGPATTIVDVDAMPEPTADEVKALAAEAESIRDELDREEARRAKPPRTFPLPPQKPTDGRNEDVADILVAGTPPLNKHDGSWVKNTDAAELESVTTATLTTYRSLGFTSNDQMIGRDKDGRVWRRKGTATSHPWYLRSTLRSQKKK